MRKRVRVLILGVISLLVFSGCGTPIYEMTDEEENLIVQGAAYFLSKRNLYQKDGVNGTLPRQKEEETSEPQKEETSSEEQKPQQKPNSSVGGLSGDDTQLTQGVVTLAEAIGMKNVLQVSFEKSEVTSVYQEGTYFSLNAGEGKRFIVLYFQISNPTASDVTLANYEKEISFYGIFDGSLRIPEKQTFIADSLSSFEGTIKANGTERAVLIFETTKEKADNMQETKLQVKIDDTIYGVEM